MADASSTPFSDPSAAAGTADRDEVRRFDRQAAQWWDPNGEFRALHQMNPLRIGYIRDRVCRHRGRDADLRRALAGLDIADIGCGGGLLSEPLASLGARVTGIDASRDGIAVARAHARQRGLAIDYREMTAEALAGEGARFDVVVASEIVEHVARRGQFMAALAELLRPNGALIMSTINRTLKSYALAIVAAERVLQLVAPGTHEWRKFIRPSELARELRDQGLRVEHVAGMLYEPWAGRWRVSDRDLEVNYILFAAKE